MQGRATLHGSVVLLLLVLPREQECESRFCDLLGRLKRFKGLQRVTLPIYGQTASCSADALWPEPLLREALPGVREVDFCSQHVEAAT
jgi:hypothetical protein